MLSLTGIPLLIAAVLLATTAPLLAAWWWRRNTKTGWVSGLRPLAAVLACQLFAISALFLWVNNEYGFYTSWSDLLECAPRRDHPEQRFARPGAGRLEVDRPGRHAPTMPERCGCGSRPSISSRSLAPQPFRCSWCCPIALDPR